MSVHPEGSGVGMGRGAGSAKRNSPRSRVGAGMRALSGSTAVQVDPEAARASRTEMTGNLNVAELSDDVGGIVGFRMQFGNLQEEEAYSAYVAKRHRAWRTRILCAQSTWSIFGVLAWVSMQDVETWIGGWLYVSVVGIVLCNLLVIAHSMQSGPQWDPSRSVVLATLTGLELFFSSSYREVLCSFGVNAFENSCAQQQSAPAGWWPMMWIMYKAIFLTSVGTCNWHHTFLCTLLNFTLYIAAWAVVPFNEPITDGIMGVMLPLAILFLMVRHEDYKHRVAYIIERSLIIRRIDAEAKAATQEAVTNYVAHELRNPIHGVVGCVQVLEMGGDEAVAVEYQEDLASISQCATHIVRICDDLLELGKLRSGRMKLSPKPTSLIGLLYRSVSQMRRMAKVPIVITFEEGLPEVINIDGLRISQVISNALSNSSKATISGSIEVHVSRPGHHRPTTGGGWLRVTVSDTGPGIGDATEEQLFEAFASVTSRYKAQGAKGASSSGLGLAISSMVVRDAMGGEIHLRNRTTSPTPMALIAASELQEAQLAVLGREAEQVRPGRGAVLEFEIPLGQVDATYRSEAFLPAQERAPQRDALWSQLRPGKGGTIVLRTEPPRVRVATASLGGDTGHHSSFARAMMGAQQEWDGDEDAASERKDAVSGGSNMSMPGIPSGEVDLQGGQALPTAPDRPVRFGMEILSTTSGHGSSLPRVAASPPPDDLLHAATLDGSGKSKLDTAGESASQTVSHRAVRDAGITSKTTVLVCDEKMINRRLAKRILKRCGIRVVECSDGRSIVPALRSNSNSGGGIDAVLTDLTMQDNSPVDALQSAQVEGFSGIPFGIVTGDPVVLQNEVLFGLQGFDGVLAKPYTEEQLLDLLQRMVPRLSLARPRRTGE